MDISNEISRFKTHIGLRNNEHIIFSGIFGIGKTTFLNSFFISCESIYEVFKLCPVNYSIAQTDDIIDYIKYDIAFQLIGKRDSIFEKNYLPISLTAQFYILNNPLDVAASIAKNIGKTGVAVGTAIETIKKLYDDAKKHNAILQVDEEKELTDWLKEITNKKGSIFEENAITQIISSTIDSIKKESKKETVLVIDDLDRLDPEHIFRILNVFACHFDLGVGKEKNKFGFDKIILVCDIENIRGIYHSKYGQDVDFSGYIDKFYSHEIYYFDNKVIVSEGIEHLLKSIVIDQALKNRFNINNSQILSTSLLIEIVTDLLKYDLLNLRTLFKLDKKNFQPAKYKFTIGNGKADSWDFTIILIFDILTAIYGSSANLASVLDKLAKRSPLKLFIKNCYSIIIELIDYKTHACSAGNYEYLDPSLDIGVFYSISHVPDSSEIYAEIKAIMHITNPAKNKTTFPFAIFLKRSFDEYIRLSKIQ